LKNIVDNNLGEKIILYPYGVGNKIESVKIGNIDLTSSTNFGGTSIVDTLEDNYNSMKVNLIPVDVLNTGFTLFKDAGKKGLIGAAKLTILP
jgi:hypothetical protein